MIENENFDENNKKNDESYKFYDDAKKYWTKIPATVNGMLGGFGYISDTDIKASKVFLYSLFKLENGPGRTQALDCGCGIGRITKNLLIPAFQKVDMVEQNENFINESKAYIGRLNYKIGSRYVMGLQDFAPKTEFYDVIWCQWVLGHLKDDDFVTFLNRCQLGLKKHGIVVIKENVTSSNQVELDTEDSSVTRPHSLMLEIFKKSNLECFKDVRQTNFPKGLYAVHMFALRPKITNEKDNEKENNEIDLSDKLKKLNVDEK